MKQCTITAGQAQTAFMCHLSILSLLRNATQQTCNDTLLVNLHYDDCGQGHVGGYVLNVNMYPPWLLEWGVITDAPAAPQSGHPKRATKGDTCLQILQHVIVIVHQ